MPSAYQKLDLAAPAQPSAGEAFIPGLTPGVFSLDSDNPFSWSPHLPGYDGPFGGDFQFDFRVAQVPEPSASFLLLGVGLAGLSGFAWWRRRN